MILSDEPSDRKTEKRRREHRTDTLWVTFYALAVVGLCVWHIARHLL